MDPKERKTYGTLDTSDVSAQGEDYSLEEILAEFGGSLEQTLLRGTEPEPEGEEPPASREVKQRIPQMSFPM